MQSLWFDLKGYLRCLTMRRVSNALLVWISFYSSRLFGHTFHWGRPLSVSIEPTTACNLGCPECPSGLKMFSRPTGSIDKKAYEVWMDEVALHAMHVNFYFQGEPFIHRDFLEMVSYANGRGLFTSTSTNGHFLTEEMALKTIQSGLRRLIFSIDGTTQEVYEQYRIHGRLDQVLRGAEAVIKAKRQLKSAYPQVIFQFLVVKPNEHQIKDVLNLGEQMGADEVRLKTAQVYDYRHGNPLIPTNEKYSRYVRLKDGSYRVKNSLDHHCWRMWSGCVVTWDGKVVPCCFDKDATHVLGDLNQASMAAIWNSKPYRQFRSAIFKSRSSIDICSNCSEGTSVWTEA